MSPPRFDTRPARAPLRGEPVLAEEAGLDPHRQEQHGRRRCRSLGCGCSAEHRRSRPSRSRRVSCRTEGVAVWPASSSTSEHLIGVHQHSHRALERDRAPSRRRCPPGLGPLVRAALVVGRASRRRAPRACTCVPARRARVGPGQVLPVPRAPRRRRRSPRVSSPKPGSVGGCSKAKYQPGRLIVGVGAAWHVDLEVDVSRTRSRGTRPCARACRRRAARAASPSSSSSRTCHRRRRPSAPARR